MIYPIFEKKISQNERATLNEKILMSVLRGKKDFANTDIYNYYTGIGGLHGLEMKDFANFHDYTEAKKSLELGQFFTPHRLCQQMVELAAPTPSETVLDMCCGIGNFFNHLPNQYNAFGFDIDENAVKVAKRLYSDANIEVKNMQFYDPNMSFDMILGNPPFGLDIEGVKSQYFFSHKAFWMLKPAGLMLLVMPKSYLASESGDRTYINMINRDFSFVGQTCLSANTFKSVGVDNFETKVMAFLRKSDFIEQQPYLPEEFITIQQLKLRLDDVRAQKRKLKLKLLQEENMYSEGSIQSRLRTYKESKSDTGKDGKKKTVVQKSNHMDSLFKSLSANTGGKSFDRAIDKYLYELKTHKQLRSQYARCEAYVAKYRNQRPPLNCTDEERKHWEKHVRISADQVLRKLRRIIKRQNVVAQKKYDLVSTQYGYKLKNRANPFSDRITDKYVSMVDIIANDELLPYPKTMTPELRLQYNYAKKHIAKKKREFIRQTTKFKDMQRDEKLDKYIDGLTFVGMKKKVCRFSDLQKHDAGLLFQRNCSLLNWQQGSGKTAVLYHFGKYQLHRGTVKNVVIVAPSNALHMTWENFLKYNNEDYILASRPEHLEDIPVGKFVIISVSMLGKVDDALRLFMKKRSQKICLLFDESDELTSDQSLRTKRTLRCFRRAKYKMLGTGTTTRNYISELYSQFQLLYNSSVYFMCYCREIYYEDDECNIKSKLNNYYLKPFPLRGGAYLFKACFNPGKATVFGIEKQNQDVYNKQALWDIIERTIITRKFKEFAGDKYTIHTHPVEPGTGELGVYEKIIKDFMDICYMYFNSTDDSRKESALKIVRQIQLLIKACSVPDMMPGYISEKLPRKVAYIENMVRNMQERVAIGCTSIDALEYYGEHFKQAFPDRPLFIIKGDVTFQRRQKLIRQFEATDNGILICTQQSLKSSINIPECNEVILESLQWNIPRMEQFYFRFIRFDSEGYTNVHFVNYCDSIEQNIMALILTKERLNDFIQTGEVTEESAVFDEFGVSTSIIDSMFTREQDKDGKFHICWGKQKIVA
ncbi:MAG: N-6 DNA methylase [Prevotella sp.]|jgi:SAM-dependent methyltransferase|nr:N-6 DNA methylase [Prevotella sp.]